MKKTLLFPLTSLLMPSLLVAQITYNANGVVQNGSIQQYIVPPCVNSVSVEAFGAQGGNTNGGLGARMKGNFSVTFGDTLFIVVGQQGNVNSCGGAGASGGGGGGSFVWKGSGNNKVLFIAAGGGGGGNTNWPGACVNGIDADTLTSGTQGNGISSALGGTNGNGGFGNAPSGTGSGGAGWLSNGQNSTWGGGCTGGLTFPLFTGGNGSNTFGPNGHGGYGGGGGAVCGCGGGGGYSGGGAGEGSSCRAGGGGGGSYNSGTNQSNSKGVQGGNGKVIITEINSFSFLTVSVLPNDTVCEGTLVTLTGNGGNSYVWNNGVTNGVPFAANATTTYKVIATHNNGCIDSAYVTVEVNTLPTVSFQVSSDTLCNTSPSFTLSGGVPGGGAYSGSGVSSGTFNPGNAQIGWNIITYSFSDLNGCTNTDSDSIYVLDCTGINTLQLSDNGVKMYPNPAKNKLIIESEKFIPNEIMIADLNGKILLSYKPNDKKSELDISVLNTGNYLVKIKYNQGERIIKLSKH
ncbi:MAG: T9SS type A sorting domain-containing protein [Flavobacteriales bacterium]|nr:T9SS type A sorting domain-containing protein [Flavobacteriales bacterium]